MKIREIAIVGLGYVGLPLAVSLSKKYKVLGFDINKKRIQQVKRNFDETNEVSTDQLKKSFEKGFEVSFKTERLKQSNVFIITVPTPVNRKNKPELRPLLNACKTVGKNLKKGDIIIFESTVYPGLTQEVCGNELQKYSGLSVEKDFFLGYSPERINPGDKIHTVEKIAKVISSENKNVEKVLREIYSNVTNGLIFTAKNIMVAEASKVIENAQRDINIAFMNEIAKICQKLNISVYDVLDASKTKWNFLPFYPGLVGGHCIGVDPYYLADVAKRNKVKPLVVLSGRKTNDDMSKFIFNQINNKTKRKSKILILGLTFKENVPDLRNSKVFDLLRFFKKSHDVFVCDPLVENISEKKIEFLNFENLIKHKFDVIILAVAHKLFKELEIDKLKRFLKKNGLIADLTGIWRHKKDIKNYWSL
tara:strand:- start:326 stop:1585 length:1260 start_codon:yes stop_codon:yes gene_type:complete